MVTKYPALAVSLEPLSQPTIGKELRSYFWPIERDLYVMEYLMVCYSRPVL